MGAVYGGTQTMKRFLTVLLTVIAAVLVWREWKKADRRIEMNTRKDLK